MFNLFCTVGAGQRLCGYQTKSVKSDPMIALMNDLFATEDRNYLYTNLLEVFEAHIADTGPLSAFEISELLYRLGKKKFRSEGTKGLVIDPFLGELITRSLASCSLNGRWLSRAMQLLIILPFSSDEVSDKIVAAFTRKLHTGVTLNEIDLSMCLYALQSKKEDERAVLTLVQALAGRVSEKKYIWSMQNILNGLHGLQSMSGDLQGVRDILSALTTNLFISDDILTTQGISCALYGLQSMSSDLHEVRILLKVLAGKIASSDTVLDCQGIGNALYGL